MSNQARSASELRDIAYLFEVGKIRDDQQDAKLAAHDQAFARVDMKQQTYENQLEILREAIKGYCDDLLRRTNSAIDSALTEIRESRNGH